MRVERKNEITFRVYNFNFFLLLFLLPPSCGPVSSRLRANREETHMKMKIKHWDENREDLSCVWLFYFILFRFFLLLLLSILQLIKQVKVMILLFTESNKHTAEKKSSLAWSTKIGFAPSHRRASSASCVAFMPALDLLIFRVVSSRNWRMGKYVRVFTSNWSPHRRGESDAWRRQSTLSFHFSSSATANG